MNIGIFTDCYTPQINGVVTSVLMLKEELNRRGHQVYIITVKTKHSSPSSDVIHIHSIPFSKWKEFRIGLPIFLSDYKKIKDLHLDLIHTHTEFSIGLLGKSMSRILKIPLLHTYHTMYENYTHYVLPLKYGKSIAQKAIRAGSRIYLKNYHAVIAPSQKTKDALEGYGVKNNIHVLPTGIKLEHFFRNVSSDEQSTRLRQSLGISQETKVILSLGRLSEEKNIHFMIVQMKLLMKTLPNIKFVIVGDGPYRDKLKKLSDEQDLSEVILFIGSVPWQDVPAYYHMSDVFVSASETETQGLTIFEAMAAGTPVVAFNDDNIQGILHDRKSGFLFTNGVEFREAIHEVLLDSEVRHSLTQNAFEIVQTLTHRKYGETAERIYVDLVENL